MKTLTELKGIGPATASLLLSVHAPGQVPFFSDELFRWTMWDESGKPGGWQRVIKYSAKEYEALVKRVAKLVERLDVRAVDAEKVAWVLGKEKVDLEADSENSTEAELPNGAEAGEQAQGEEPRAPEENSNKTKLPPDAETIDVETQCSVPLPKGGSCIKDLACKRHSLGAKRAVPGRSAPFDQLLAKSQKIPEAPDRPEATSQTKTAKRGVKRKAADAKPPTEGVRRSGRRRIEVAYAESP